MRWSKSLLCLLMFLLASACAGNDRVAFDPKPLFPGRSGLPRHGADEQHPAGLSAPAPWIKVDLPAVLGLAGANDLQIKKAQERVKELDAQKDEALDRFFPKLLPGASFSELTGQYMSTVGRFLDVTRQQTLAGIKARLDLDLGDAIYGLRAARHRYQEGKLRAFETEQERMLKASRGYFDLLAAVQAIEIAREAARASKEELAYHTSRQARGLGLAVDVERARAQVEADAQALTAAELHYRDTSARLAVQLRLNPATTLYPTGSRVRRREFLPQGISLKELLNRALKAHPSIFAARENLLSREQELKAAQQAWMIPHIFLEGSVDARGENPSRFGDTEFVSGGIAWEISLGQGARSRAAFARRNMAAMDLAHVREKLIADLVATHARLGLNRQSIQAAERRILAAQQALKLAEARQRAGTGLLIEVLDARLDLTRARMSRLEALTAFNKNQVSLLVLSGLGTTKLLEANKS